MLRRSHVLIGLAAFIAVAALKHGMDGSELRLSLGPRECGQRRSRTRDDMTGQQLIQ